MSTIHQIEACENNHGPDRCCATRGYALSCVHAHRLQASAEDAAQFDCCRNQMDDASHCWSKLPDTAKSDASALCAQGATVWCDQIAQLEAGPTFAVAAIGAAACLLLLRRHLKRRA